MKKLANRLTNTLTNNEHIDEQIDEQINELIDKHIDEFDSTIFFSYTTNESASNFTSKHVEYICYTNKHMSD